MEIDHIPINWHKSGQKWHTWTFSRPCDDTLDWIDFYTARVSWIQDYVDGSYKHSCWCIWPEFATYKFRYEKDYLNFILRWS